MMNTLLAALTLIGSLESNLVEIVALSLAVSLSAVALALDQNGLDVVQQG